MISEETKDRIATVAVLSVLFTAASTGLSAGFAAMSMPVASLGGAAGFALLGGVTGAVASLGFGIAAFASKKEGVLAGLADIAGMVLGSMGLFASAIGAYISYDAYGNGLNYALRKEAKSVIGENWRNAVPGSRLDTSVTMSRFYSAPVQAEVTGVKEELRTLSESDLTPETKSAAGTIGLRTCVTFNVTSAAISPDYSEQRQLCTARPLTQNEVRALTPAP